MVGDGGGYSYGNGYVEGGSGEGESGPALPQPPFPPPLPRLPQAVAAAAAAVADAMLTTSRTYFVFAHLLDSSATSLKGFEQW